MAIAISTITPAERAAHERRLDALKLRLAHDGYNAPVEVRTEIDEITAILSGAEREPADEAERYAVLAQQLAVLAQQTASMTGIILKTEQNVNRLLWATPGYMLLLVIVLIVLVAVVR